MTDLRQEIARAIRDKMTCIVSGREAKIFSQAAIDAIEAAGFAIVPKADAD